jgi:hypothetical protein
MSSGRNQPLPSFGTSQNIPYWSLDLALDFLSKSDAWIGKLPSTNKKPVDIKKDVTARIREIVTQTLEQQQLRLLNNGSITVSYTTFALLIHFVNISMYAHDSLQLSDGQHSELPPLLLMDLKEEDIRKRCKHVEDVLALNQQRQAKYQQQGQVLYKQLHLQQQNHPPLNYPPLNHQPNQPLPRKQFRNNKNVASQHQNTQHQNDQSTTANTLTSSSTLTAEPSINDIVPSEYDRTPLSITKSQNRTIGQLKAPAPSSSCQVMDIESSIQRMKSLGQMKERSCDHVLSYVPKPQTEECPDKRE